MAKSKLNVDKLTPQQIAHLASVIQNIYEFSKEIWVVNPVHGRVRFLLYPFQKAVLYEFIRERFNIVLKFRQAGITELISMYCLWLAQYHPNKRINIISIKDSVAKKVLKKIKFMYKNLPWYLQVPIVNGRSGDYGTATTIEFYNGSMIESIPTSDQAGRSESLSLLVIDEAAVVRWASSIWASAMPTLSTGGSAIVNSCITGDTEIITQNGTIRVDMICPKQFGQQDIKALGLKTLSHKGQWQNIIGSVNKGLLETWEIRNNRGHILKCTPAHKLLTPRGWKTVEDIVKLNIDTIFFDTGLSSLQEPPNTQIPKQEILKPIQGFDNYQVSNYGNIYRLENGSWVKKDSRITDKYSKYLRIGLWKNCKKHNFSIHRLVAETFLGKIPKGYVVDHINNNPLDNYVTNLEIVTASENTQRATKYSYNLTLGNNSGKGAPDLQLVGWIKSKSHLVKNYGDGAKLARRASKKFNKDIKSEYVNRIVRKERCKSIYVSKLQVLRKYEDYIYDISVENDQSYIIPNGYVSHNTPMGIGGFYHGLWVDAITGNTPVNPIRLYWQMHPDRDEKWYKDMAKVLGPKRTAQEIDGDFLSSGNTVFELSDIKAIEDGLFEYPVIRTLLNEQYKEFNKPDIHDQYYIGADCSTGRSSDYSAFTLMNQAGEEQACFKGRIPLNKYARFLGDIGERYNYALLAPEANDVGMTVVSILQDEGYPNLYYSRKILKKRGKSKPEQNPIPGWLTTTANRSLIIEGLEKDIREDNVIIKDPYFTNEAYTFIYDYSGRPVAMGKSRAKDSSDIDLESETYSDDAIFGKAICNHVRKFNNLNNIVVMPQ